MPVVYATQPGSQVDADKVLLLGKELEAVHSFGVNKAQNRSVCATVRGQ